VFYIMVVFALDAVWHDQREKRCIDEMLSGA